MKHLLLLTIFLLSTTVLVTAQNGKGKGQDKAAKNMAKSHHKAVKSIGKAHSKAAKGQGTSVEININPTNKVEVDVKPVTKEKENKGHAYGKNKGHLSGRNFGQARAAAARSKNKAKKQRAQIVIKESRGIVIRARDKVAITRKQLELDFANKTISITDYNAKKKKLALIEQKIVEVESKEQKLQITITN